MVRDPLARYRLHHRYFGLIRSQRVVVISSLGIALPSWPINFIRLSFYGGRQSSLFDLPFFFCIRKG